MTTDCWYCGRKGHRESECWKRRADSDKAGSSRGDVDRRQRSHNVEVSGRAEMGPTFVMRHKTNIVAVNTSRSNEVWYVDSGASNHMTNHKEWFSTLEKSKQTGVVETSDDTPHPIEHIGDVPLSHVGQKGIMRNVLHVPTITKNLVSVGQIVNQGMQVRFTHLGCFIEEEGKVIAQGRQEGRMFILETKKSEWKCLKKGKSSSWTLTYGTSGSAMSTSHRFENANFSWLREMQTKNIVIGIPKFSGRKGQVYEACQLGKHHRLPFPNE